MTLNEEDASGSGEGPTRRDNRRFGKDFHDETDNEDEVRLFYNFMVLRVIWNSSKFIEKIQNCKNMFETFSRGALIQK